MLVLSEEKNAFFPFNIQDLGKVRKIKKNKEDKVCLAKLLGRPLGDLDSKRQIAQC